VKLAVVAFPGSSKDVYEALTDQLHLDAEIVPEQTTNLANYDGIMIAGGASYGDYLRPGAIASTKKVIHAVREQAAAGKPVLGIGNGFQVLTEAGLLPGALLQNESLLFTSGKQAVTVENNDTLFTATYDKGESVQFPVAHKYGNYYCDEETLETLKKNHQIVFTYQTNPNGSIENIAGITNEQGNVLGMMPHPERALEAILGSEDGAKLFKSLAEKWRECNAN
jgi:phosphoribosylformylglycinamidine synthase